MVQVDLVIKDIETNSTGRMITLVVDATVAGQTEETRFTEMVGNLRGMTDAEVREHFKGILENVIHQRLGEKEELTPEKIWKRKSDFIGTTYTIEVV